MRPCGLPGSRLTFKYNANIEYTEAIFKRDTGNALQFNETDHSLPAYARNPDALHPATEDRSCPAETTPRSKAAEQHYRYLTAYLVAYSTYTLNALRH